MQWNTDYLRLTLLTLSAYQGIEIFLHLFPKFASSHLNYLNVNLYERRKGYVRILIYAS